MIRVFIILIALIAPVAEGAWLEWDRNIEANTVGYRAYWSTNSRSYDRVLDVKNTNVVWLPFFRLKPETLYLFAVTAYSPELLESEFSDEVSYFTPPHTNIYVPPITNILLRVPSGKFYIESSDTLAQWLAMGVVMGPTNVVCAATNKMGFYRWRSYFVSAASPKRGKLTVAKAVMFKAKQPAAKALPVSGPPPAFPSLPPVIAPTILRPPGTPPTPAPLQQIKLE